MVAKQELTLLRSQHHTILTIRSKKENRYLLLQNIIYIEASGSYSIFYTSDKKSYISTKRLGHYQQLLQEVSFVRIHNSYLVNRLHIKSYHVIENDLIVTGNIHLQVSFRRRKIIDFL